MEDFFKNRKALRKEIKRRFIIAVKKEMQKETEEEINRILYGDDSKPPKLGTLKVREK